MACGVPCCLFFLESRSPRTGSALPHVDPSLHLMDDGSERHLAERVSKGCCDFLTCWLDLEKCCFVEDLVIFYEDHLSVAGKLDTPDE